MLKQHDYMPQMLSKSRLNRRLHRLKAILIIVFKLLAPSTAWQKCRFL